MSYAGWEHDGSAAATPAPASPASPLRHTLASASFLPAGKPSSVPAPWLRGVFPFILNISRLCFQPSDTWNDLSVSRARFGPDAFLSLGGPKAPQLAPARRVGTEGWARSLGAWRLPWLWGWGSPSVGLPHSQGLGMLSSAGAHNEVATHKCW